MKRDKQEVGKNGEGQDEVGTCRVQVECYCLIRTEKEAKLNGENRRTHRCRQEGADGR